MRKELLEFKEKYKKPPLIGYLPALYPDSDKAGETMRLAYETGLRFIETGIPTSDPYLDGDIIRKALKELSRSELTIQGFLNDSGRDIKASGMHGTAMLYHESLIEYGIDKILHDAGRSGIEAILVPNISKEYRVKLHEASIGSDVEIVNFIGFHDSMSDIAEVAELTTGFLYMQSTDGSTGGQFSANRESEQRLQMVKEIASPLKLPVALGFGINSPEDADAAAQMGADAIIVGTAFLKAVQNGRNEFVNFINSFRPYLSEDKCSQYSL
ncbi:MAG: tryptophan synthase subunit alpha [Spirochaetales bacterium]|nr:tryptophan synthase subunit alpha [Spirochaetales bacterium]